MVRIPQITSLETAIKLYYENIEIGNQEIKELFGPMGSARVCNSKIWQKKKCLKKMFQIGMHLMSIPKPPMKHGALTSKI